MPMCFRLSWLGRGTLVNRFYGPFSDSMLARMFIIGVGCTVFVVAIVKGQAVIPISRAANIWWDW